MQLNHGRIAWHEVDGEAVVLDLDTSTYFSVNGTGTVLLRALDHEADEESLVAALSQASGRPGHELRSDVEAFVADLRARGLLTGEACEPMAPEMPVGYCAGTMPGPTDGRAIHHARQELGSG